MTAKTSRETMIGAATLGLLLALLSFNAADRDEAGGGVSGYPLEAVFQRTDGLAVGAPVRLAGLEVGKVVGQTLDGAFRAHVALRLQAGVAVPEDSAAIIETDGLLGSKYIEIQPGGAEDMLSPGGRFDYTQSSVVIEELLAKIISMAKARRAAGPEAATAPGAPAGTVAPAPEADAPFPSLLAPLPEEGGDDEGDDDGEGDAGGAAADGQG
jgi:phospholipid/cholesterol/gamma-HCH transport system substrate-binding protein